ncbi:MAG TPA: aspartate/glutamate racemase family protein [Fluviicola sp.]|nr:aspartate/glutamate racemase family protein [Fluviicola sp.]
MTIGICDYGIGGVSLYKQLRTFSDVDVVYFSDTGVPPYGKLPDSELRPRVARVVEFLFDQGCEFVAIACNAASTASPIHPEVINMIEFGVKAVEAVSPKSLGIVGGYRTVESEIYKQPLSVIAPNISQEVGQALSVRIEAGDLVSEEMTADLERIFTPLKNCEAILLACTHYPVLTNQINAVIPGVQLIDPMERMVKAIRMKYPDLNGNGTTRWMTSGSVEKMRVAAKKAFDVELETIEYMEL